MQSKLKEIRCAPALSAVTLISVNELIANQQKLAAPEKLSDGIVVHLGDSILNVEGILLGVEAGTDRDAERLEKTFEDLGAEHIRQE